MIRADEMEYVMSVPFACVVSLSLLSEKSRGGGVYLKSLGDGKLKKVSRFVGRRDFCVPVCVWKYEESYGRV